MVERRADSKMGKKHRVRLRYRRRLAANKRGWQRILAWRHDGNS